MGQNETLLDLLTSLHSSMGDDTLHAHLEGVTHLGRLWRDTRNTCGTCLMFKGGCPQTYYGQPPLNIHPLAYGCIHWTSVR